MIGETARIGSDCIILHGVTLGGVGKHIADITDAHCSCMNASMAGRRHPTVGSGVLVGCNATILGPICIGDGAKIGSASVVLKSVPARCTAVGSPARIIGRSHHATTDTEDAIKAPIIEYSKVGAEPAPDENLYSVVYLRTWTLWADCIDIFSVVKDDENATISMASAIKIWAAKVSVTENEIPINFLQKAFRSLNVADPSSGEEVSAKELEVAIITHIKDIEDSYHYSYQI